MSVNKAAKVKLTTEDKEPLPPVEEHIILRIQNAPLAAKLKDLAVKREPMDDLSILMHGPRKGTLKYSNDKFPATLVDLPCIIESQKTWDNRQLYKICDISQMLVVDDPANPIPEETTDEYVWPHGISAPLQYVRKRRFRKRISKRAIENVEREVERLLKADAEAIQVERDLVEVAPGQEEEAAEGEDREEGEEGEEGEITPPDGEQGEVEDDEFDDVMGEIDEAIEEELGGEDDEDHAAQAVDSDDEGEEVKQLREEIAEMDETIAEKEQEAQKQMNPIMKMRFEGIVKKLNEERSKKQAALQALLSD
ncbi:hypothetical protein BCR33DRAFT_845225 [Rhizoclosmatium globosum]|uniref:TAFII55 protein conserved region domain-containing protein n=1 Tax=Rhizoclosmatium globosum TaxID=329046 RepID=A0A1Y2D136_9FUNG|nr:hypothetical protein BCR33DRAFT_845225 [Rhizoclosmatium globosum]|eukprot:ORY52960.1 hypothetical protein BCR33DRAFT_845225 [Rhizoclosmatium globosum]